MLVQCSPLFRKLSLKFLFLPLFTCAFCFWCAVGRAPGYLLNNLAVEKIRTGNPKIGNPILASYAAKGPFPYRGPGSGIKRALEDWPEIDLTGDRDGCLFTATVHRREEGSSPEKFGDRP